VSVVERVGVFGGRGLQRLAGGHVWAINGMVGGEVAVL
jgi:hypothetical protein